MTQRDDMTQREYSERQRKKLSKKRMRRRLWKIDPKCHWCGVETLFNVKHEQRKDFATVDHVFPLAAGGTNDIENLTIACRECNNHRGDGEDYQFGTKLGDLLKTALTRK